MVKSEPVLSVDFSHCRVNTPDELILIKAKEAQTSENRLLQTTQVQPPSSQSCKDPPDNPTAGSAASKHL